MELRGPLFWECPKRGVPGIRGHSRCSWGDLCFRNAPVRGHYVFISIVLSTACHPFSSKACYVRFHLPPDLNPSSLCIPFELWSYNLSFLLNRMHSFFASHSNSGNAIWASSEIASILSLHPVQTIDIQLRASSSITSLLFLHTHWSFLCIHENYGQTIFASSLNCSCPFFAYPLKLCAWAFLPDWIHSLLIPKSADCESWNKAYLYVITVVTSWGVHTISSLITSGFIIHKQHIGLHS